jgi:hypothetical protein
MTLIELLPASVDLAIYRGDTFLQEFIWEQPAATPVNITGYNITAQVRLKQDADDPALETFTTTITDGPAGKFTLGLTATQTQGLPKKPMYWDVQYLNGSEKRTLMAGKIKLTKDVTRP